MGYRLYNPVTKKVIFSRDVIFEENESWNWDQTKASRSAELMPEEETREMATEPQIPRDQQTPQRGSSSPQRYDAPLPIERDFSDMMPRGTRSLEDLYENTEQVEEDVTLYCLLMTSDPVSFEEANQEEKWRSAMDEEIRSIEKNKTWEAVVATLAFPDPNKWLKITGIPSIKIDRKFILTNSFLSSISGKELWGYIDGSIPKPEKGSDSSQIAKWESNDAKVISWILSSIDSHIILNLQSYTCAKDMWEYLKKVYHQENSARRFQLELEISEYSQGNMSIHDYYSGFMNLWSEYKELIYANVPSEGLSALQQVQEISQRDCFLMKLRRDFEPVRANLMARNPCPSLDICFGELLREEQRCTTQNVIEQTNGGSNPLDVAFATQAKARDMSKVQCYRCNEYGHIANQCKKKFCNYCKKSRHLISDCRRRPQNRTSQAFNVVSSTFTPTTVPSESGSNNLTSEMVQQMIQSAFSAFGLTGKDVSSSLWYIDSAASNHMTSSLAPLANVKPYVGNMQIRTANGETLPIKSVGDIPHTLPLTNVFHAPDLTSNLISVGQLVDENCNVSFSTSGCVVQDQDSGKVIGKGPKCGRLFSLSMPNYLRNKNLFSFFSLTSSSLSKMWHKRLGHPNVKTLLYLSNSGLFSNDDSISFNCDSYRKGFLCYDPIAHRIRISRNVVFIENQYFFPNTYVPNPPALFSYLYDFGGNNFNDDNNSNDATNSNFIKFKPGLVYQRRGQIRSQETEGPDKENSPAPNPPQEAPSTDLHQEPPLLRRSTRMIAWSSGPTKLGMDKFVVELSEVILVISVIPLCTHREQIVILIEVRGKLPQSVKKLDIGYCEKLQCLLDDNEDTCNSSSSKFQFPACLLPEENAVNTYTSHLEDLYLSGCPALTCLLSTDRLSITLTSLTIGDCSKLTTLSSTGQLPMLLKHLVICRCSELTTLLPKGQLPETLETLSISDCKKLEWIVEKFHNNKALCEIYIFYCNNLKSFPEGLHTLSSLRSIKIEFCNDFASFPKGEFPNSNFTLVIKGCKKLEALPNKINTLSSLKIYDCPNMSLSEEGLFTKLESLSITSVKQYKALIQLGLHNFTSLTYLGIYRNLDRESLQEEDMKITLPRSLTSLWIRELTKLKYLPFKGLEDLPSLEFLWISSCAELISLPSLPSSLSELQIRNCPLLKELTPLSSLPSSLLKLYIIDCPLLKELTSLISLPSSLLELCISNCPLLKKTCKRDREKGWSKIADIPYVEIDNKFIYDPNEESEA
ncbi:hypothetical protein EZV62_009275 [Acer yangbiense]|uniref:CCHC-type domain-containing protein n=1 Tax=Acer yangbiense TaxID=1000413 RepID=A0A5C7IF88_9ROSI|nr:hypothetical protein EZV62_009275 [Acer yangbiense]